MHTFLLIFVNITIILGINTQPHDIIQVHDNVPDSYETGDVTTCGLIGIANNRSCNFRSAVEYCVSVSTAKHCDIYLPEGGKIELDSKWNHIYITNRIQADAEFLTIVGHNSTISRLGSRYARVIDVNANPSLPFSLIVQDVSIYNFNGAFYLQGLRSFHCTNVIFERNEARGGMFWSQFNNVLSGGALYINKVDVVTIEYSKFFHNYAYSKGGTENIYIYIYIYIYIFICCD
jgi:hypothetical protein